MNRDRIRTSLEEALSKSVLVNDMTQISFPGLAPVMTRSLPSDAEAVLISALKSEPELSIFDGRVQWFFDTGASTSYEQLGRWLLDHTGNVGADEAVTSLEIYLRTAEIPYTQIAAVAGVSVEPEVNLPGGVRLRRFDAVPDSIPKRLFSRMAFDVYLHRQPPEAAFSSEVSVKKRHSTGPVVDPSPHQSRFWDFWDLADLFSALGPHPARMVGLWATPPSWVPGGDRAFSYWGSPLVDQSLRPVLLQEKTIAKVNEAYEALLRLDRDRRLAFRVPLGRLAQSVRHGTSVDGAIDAGIALESLLLDDMSGDRGEIGFRLQVRAARLLGVSGEERKELREKVRRLYQLRSTSAHAGKLRDVAKSHQVLIEGRDVVGRLLVKILREGAPNWTDVVFG
jgi:hypothetical protein